MPPISQMLAILQAADDPVHAEQPAGFDWPAAIARVRAVIPELEQIARAPFVLDTNVQDATFFADLSIQQPGSAPSQIDTIIAFRFSSFGNLFTTWRPVAAAQLARETLQQLIAAIERQGFIYVEAAQLHSPYTGSHLSFGQTSWWYRFFDWL